MQAWFEQLLARIGLFIINRFVYLSLLFLFAIVDIFFRVLQDKYVIIHLMVLNRQIGTHLQNIASLQRSPETPGKERYAEVNEEQNRIKHGGGMGFMGITSEPVILLYGIVFMINYTVLPQLLLQKICLRENNSNFTLCNGSNVSLHDQKVSSMHFIKKCRI